MMFSSSYFLDMPIPIAKQKSWNDVIGLRDGAQSGIHYIRKSQCLKQILTDANEYDKRDPEDDACPLWRDISPSAEESLHTKLDLRLEFQAHFEIKKRIILWLMFWLVLTTFSTQFM